MSNIPMEQRFEYTIEERGKVNIIWLKGSLDIETIAMMRSDVDVLLSKGQQKVLLDFYDLKQIDSAGIGALITLFKRVQPTKGEMKISRLTGQPKEIFRFLRLEKVFEIHDNLEEAIQSFQEP